MMSSKRTDQNRPQAAEAPGCLPKAHEPQEDGAWRNHHTVFTNAKAGMDGVDKEHVQRVVYEMSKDSAHFKNEQRKQAQTQERISCLKQRASNISPLDLAHHLRKADTAVADAAATRDLTSTWLVVDMDAFFASVEELYNPDLRDKAMAVGGIGMISTANYVARRYGVRSAMPGFIARKLCPHLVFQPSNFERYREVSAKAKAIFEAFDPALESGSLDEAFLDITPYCRRHSCSGAEAAEELRRRVREEIGVTCSCGVAPNRMLAKVCADRNKPDGQYVLAPRLTVITQFMQCLPIRKIPGIGKVMEQTLNAFGIEYCSHLIEQRALLSALFSEITARYLITVGLGLGATRHGDPAAAGEVSRKGISCERTSSPLSTLAELQNKLTEISERLAEHMASEQLQGKTLTLKLKSAVTFELRTRAVTLPGHISTAQQLFQAADQLLRPELPFTARLIGIRVSAFKEQPAPEEGQRTLSSFLSAAVPPQQHPKGTTDHTAQDQQSASMPADVRPSGRTSMSHGATSQKNSPFPQSSCFNPGGIVPKTCSRAKRKREQWACQACTVVNPCHFLRCEVCDMARLGPRLTKAAAGVPARLPSLKSQLPPRDSVVTSSTSRLGAAPVTVDTASARAHAISPSRGPTSARVDTTPTRGGTASAGADATIPSVSAISPGVVTTAAMAGAVSLRTSATTPRGNDVVRPGKDSEISEGQAEDLPCHAFSTSALSGGANTISYSREFGHSCSRKVT